MPGQTRSSRLDELRPHGGTAGDEIAVPPEVDGTRTAAATVLTDDIGFERTRARFLNEDFDELHRKSHFLELGRRTAERARSSVGTMLTELAGLGFSWRDIARLVGVSVPAVQKWRRGDRASGESRQRVAYLLATCDLIVEHYGVQEIASWFETPVVAEAPLTPMDLYLGERVDLVFDFASGHIADPEQVLTHFDPGWRERYRSNFETFTADDGQLSIRPKA